MTGEVRIVAEVPDVELDGVRLFAHPEWAAGLPNVVQGISAGADMSLFGSTPAGEVTPRWLRLTEALGCTGVIHARQVHQASVLTHDSAVRGILIAAASADGHATALTGTLLAVSVADCVPISIVAPDQQAVALLHGGWRGVAAGILEAGIDVMRRRYAAPPAALHIHLGPAICGDCFEVGPEVPPQLGMGDVAAGVRVHIDLRRHLADRAVNAGVDAASVSVSAHCTRCGDAPFYSHRGGCAERQVAVLGLRPPSRQQH
jgi:polyphenol oxidase